MHSKFTQNVRVYLFFIDFTVNLFHKEIIGFLYFIVHVVKNIKFIFLLMVITITFYLYFNKQSRFYNNNYYI